jgi:hypothetical protein
MFPEWPLVRPEVFLACGWPGSVFHGCFRLHGCFRWGEHRPSFFTDASDGESIVRRVPSLYYSCLHRSHLCDSFPFESYVTTNSLGNCE